jgi:NodT family efflux transporter outer membrane factor (OMF) lipoprotein
MKMFAKTCYLTALCCVCGFYAGCTVGPDYAKPALELPEGWTEQEQKTAVSDDVLKTWWTVLNDPLLNGLVESVSLDNPDIREAYYRIEESRALRDYATGEYYPGAAFSASYTRSRESGNTAFSFPALQEELGRHSTGFDAAWELDVFGGIQRSVQSAQASLEASVESFHSIQTSLYAEMAGNYIELRTAQMRIQYALENIQSQRETLSLTENRFNAGIAPELDVSQARQNLANTEAQVPSLRLAEIQAFNRLAVLLGRYPQDFDRDLKTPGTIPVPASDTLPAVLPADLLRQRPDIRLAERQLAAQSARIGMATAEIYPSFSLSGSFYLEAEQFSDLGRGSSRSYSYGPGLRWRVFEGGRLRNLVRAEEARTGQLLAGYERTVLTAIEEVENALAAYAQESQRQEALQRSVQASEDTVRLVQSLYRSGLTDFQNVLDAQRTLSSQQDILAVSQGAVVLDLVRIYKAFGGGWDPDMIDSEPQGVETLDPDNREVEQIAQDK